MKKIIVTLMMIFCVCVAHAEHENISTSQYYVDAKSAEKQDAVPAQNANSVMTYDSTSADGIGSKAIYDTSASYAGQTKALVTASTANTAIQNGINNEFVCKNPPECTLWKIRNTTTHASGKNLFDVSKIKSTYEPDITTKLINNGDGSITVTDRVGDSSVSTHKTLAQLAPDLVVGKTYRLSFSTTGCSRFIWLSSPATEVWNTSVSKTITQNMLDANVNFYACYNGQTPSTATISNIQIEEGATATAYEPYKNLYLPANQ